MESIASFNPHGASVSYTYDDLNRLSRLVDTHSRGAPLTPIRDTRSSSSGAAPRALVQTAELSPTIILPLTPLPRLTSAFFLKLGFDQGAEAYFWVLLCAF